MNIWSRMLLRWERDHPEANLVLYNELNNVSEEKISSHSFSFSKVHFNLDILMQGILILGIFGMGLPIWQIINLINNIGNFNFLDTVFFLSTMLICILEWSVFAIIISSPIIEALYIENNNLYWLGIRVIGTKEKSFVCTPDLQISDGESSGGLSISCNSEDSFPIMKSISDSSINEKRLNAIIQERV